MAAARCRAVLPQENDRFTGRVSWFLLLSWIEPEAQLPDTVLCTPNLSNECTAPLCGFTVGQGEGHFPRRSPRYWAHRPAANRIDVARRDNVNDCDGQATVHVAELVDTKQGQPAG